MSFRVIDVVLDPVYHTNKLYALYSHLVRNMVCRYEINDVIQNRCNIIVCGFADKYIRSPIIVIRDVLHAI